MKVGVIIGPNEDRSLVKKYVSTLFPTVRVFQKDFEAILLDEGMMSYATFGSLSAVLEEANLLITVEQLYMRYHSTAIRPNYRGCDPLIKKLLTQGAHAKCEGPFGTEAIYGFDDGHYFTSRGKVSTQVGVGDRKLRPVGELIDGLFTRGWTVEGNFFCKKGQPSYSLGDLATINATTEYQVWMLQ